MVLLVMFLVIEVGIMIMSLKNKSNLKKEKSIIHVASFVLILSLIISPIIDWNFKWIALSLILSIQAITGILFLYKKKENSPTSNKKIVFSSLNKSFMIIFALIPIIILPQYKPLASSGEYSVGTASYTLTDESREEYFTDEIDNRKLTIQFWYPDKLDTNEKLPLVIFSHGAFGYRMSNYSTYQELASNGYIVCSIDHTYHAFMTKEEDGKTVIANMEFINDAMKATNGEIVGDELAALEKDWMNIRTKDMAFVLDYIKDMVVSESVDALYKAIDLDHIGVMGHSMGGATSAQIGRSDKDIDAVIVIDGTMLGEKYDVPYSKPILNIYGEDHYKEALAVQDKYPNMVACNKAPESYQVVFNESGHINFTDLPIISPILAKFLGTGDIDARYCMEETNKIILEFFNRFLKESNVVIARERIL